MLLAIHSATNWLIFYHWPSLTKTKKYSNLTLTSHNNSKTQIIDTESAELLLSRFSANKRRICTEMLSTLCMDAPHIASMCVGKDYSACKTKEHFAQHIKIQKHGAQLADIIEGVLLSLTNKNSSTGEIREHCRSIGYQHYEINLHCSAQNFKLVRDVLVLAITQSNYPKWHGSKVYQSGTANLQKTFIKVFNFALREMKSGALCAVVDANHPHLRQKSVDRTSSSKLYDKVNTVTLPKKPNGILRTCESLSFMFPRAPSLDLPTPTTTSTSPPGSRDSRMPHPTGKSHSLDTEDHTFRNGFLAQPNAVSIYDLDQLKFTDCCNGKTYAI
uniref:Globin family profile domain-containing protein n=1 Tax=Panagrolaimus sp. ES5 TaxID=591445 RepID=A0AC34FT58_9BILA